MFGFDAARCLDRDNSGKGGEGYDPLDPGACATNMQAGCSGRHCCIKNDRPRCGRWEERQGGNAPWTCQIANEGADCWEGCEGREECGSGFCGPQGICCRYREWGADGLCVTNGWLTGNLT